MDHATGYKVNFQTFLYQIGKMKFSPWMMKIALFHEGSSVIYSAMNVWLKERLEDKTFYLHFNYCASGAKNMVTSS